MSSIRAFIDLGTNTFHLLIAKVEEGSSDILFRTKKLVGLGAGGINDNKITPDAIERGLACLVEFVQQCSNHGVVNIAAFGTSALRNASNSKDFQEIVLEKTGIRIQIINGDREAELIQLGISAGISFSKEPYLIMDIGGGSTEFIVVKDDEILWKKSFEVGVQRLVSTYLNSDPISKDSLAQLSKYLPEFLSDLKAIKKYNIKALVGASGTFTTLERMYLETSESKVAKDNMVSASFFYEVFAKLISLPREERLNIPGISHPRVDLIVVGATLVNHVISSFGFTGFYVSDQGLKEGALLLAEKGKL